MEQANWITHNKYLGHNMKKLPLVTAMCAVIALAGCNKEEASVKKELVLETSEQKVSYLIGQNLGSNMGQDKFELDMDAMVAGLEEGLAGKESRISEEDARAVMMAFQAEQRAKMEAAQQEEAQKTLAEAQAFLAENATKEGVVQTESGLQYKELKAGDGATPTASDTVVVHYSGTLLDGTEFDSSHKRGKPAEFMVGALIPGWVEALQLMQVGDEWELYVPADLAYGPGGTPNIPGNSTLIFKMELLDIKAKEAPAEAK